MINYFFVLRRRRPPRTTRTDTPFPYTTLFRSAEGRGRKDRIKIGFERGNGSDRQSIGNDAIALGAELIGPGRLGAAERDEVIHRPLPPVRGAVNISFGASYTPLACKPSRSAKRRVGKVCVSTCKSGRSLYH